jgi:hypothetical protein
VPLFVPDRDRFPLLARGDALLGLLPTQLKVLFGFDRFELSALLGGLPLFGQIG